MWPYLFAIRTVVAALHPNRDATTGSGTPPSSIRVQHVCRRSWNRQRTSAASFADSHPSFQLLIGRVGSVSNACASAFAWFVRRPLRPTATPTRFVRSIEEECLDRIIPIGERHFQHVITEFVEHYHRERNHQGLDNRLIAGTPMTDRTGRVRCRRRLGGLLNFYERAA